MSPLAVVMPTVLGLASVIFVGVRLHIIGKLALAYLIGMGILGQIMFAQSASGERWSVPGLNSQILIVAATFLLFYLIVHALTVAGKAEVSKTGRGIRAAIGLVLFWYAVSRYVYPYDHVDLWMTLVLMAVVLEGRTRRWRTLSELIDIDAHMRTVRSMPAQFRQFSREFSLVDGILFLVITANAVGLIVSTLNHSPWHSDSLWALSSKATVAAQYKTIVFTDPNVVYNREGLGINAHHWASPPFYELSRIWLLLNGMKFSHHVVSAINLYALGLVLYGFLKKYVGPWGAALSALLVLNTGYYQVWIREGYTESILFAYVGLYALFAIRLVLEKDLRAGVIAFFAAGVVGFSRPETMLMAPLGLLVFGALLLLRRRFLAVALVFAVLMKMCVPWWATVYQNSYDFLFLFHKPGTFVPLKTEVRSLPTIDRAPASGETQQSQKETQEPFDWGSTVEQAEADISAYATLVLSQFDKLSSYGTQARAQFDNMVRYYPYLLDIFGHTIETKYSSGLFYLLGVILVLSLFRYREVLGILWISIPVLGTYLMARIVWLGSFEHLFAMWGSWETFFFKQQGHWWEGRYSSWSVVFLICATFMMPFYRRVFEIVQESWPTRALLATWVVYYAVL